MAKKDCPYCEGEKVIVIANTNIEMACEYCTDGRVPRPENFDPAKVEPHGLFARLRRKVKHYAYAP